MPTTNLTRYWRASVFDTYNSGGPPYGTGAGVNGSQIQYWADEQANGSMRGQKAGTAPYPTWRNPGSYAHPTMEFTTGASNYNYMLGYNVAGSGAQQLSACFPTAPTTSKTIVGAIAIKSAHANTGAGYVSDYVFSEVGGVCGIVVRSKAAGKVAVGFYNWDGGNHVIECPTDQNTNSIIVFKARQSGGLLNLKINGEDATPVATGATTTMANNFGFGYGYTGAGSLDAFIGEFATFDAGDAPGAYESLAADWLPPSSAVFNRSVMKLQAVERASTY